MRMEVDKRLHDKIILAWELENMNSRFKKQKYIVGVDEVGRGSIAGPVAVGALVFYTEKAERYFYGIRDSKKLKPKEREEWYHKICKAREEGFLEFSVSFSAHSQIDKNGIMSAINQALERSLKKLFLEPKKVSVLLDGGLSAPAIYLHQKTIIKGDEKKRIIAAASIVAKVLRDKKMVQFSKAYPLYGFERHKGYGTELHLDAIRNHGISGIHRQSFLRKIEFLRKSRQ